MSKASILTILLLILSTPAALRADEIDLPPGELGALELPSLDPLPDGLPKLVMSADGSLVLPPSWVKPVQRRWLQCDALAIQAPRALDLSAQIWSATAQAAISAAEARVAERDAELANIDVWQPWQVAVIGVAAVVGAVAVGFGAGFVASELSR